MIARTHAATGARLDTEVPVLVLRFDANPLHHGTLGAVRSLGRAGVEVHAVVESPDVPLAASRYLAAAHPWLGPAPAVATGRRTTVPVSAAGPDRPPACPAPGDVATLAALEGVAARIGRPAVLLTVDDRGAIFTAEHAAALAPLFRFPRAAADLPRRVSDKASLPGLCAAAGLPHPDTREPADEDEVRAAVAELGLPAVAKWRRPWLLPSGVGLRSTSVVRSVGEALALFARRAEAGSALLLQRRLPDGEDWFFHGYFDADARCRFAGTGRKERSHPPTAGLTSLGRWMRNDRLRALAVELVGGLGYHGVVDLDFRLDPRTGEYHLLDFNARLGAQFRLFTAADGTDLVRAVHLDLTGRPVPEAAPRHGRSFVVENYDLLAAARAAGRPRRPASAPTWSGPLRGTGEFAWFAADDPRPFLRMGALCVRRGIGRLRDRMAPGEADVGAAAVGAVSRDLAPPGRGTQGDADLISETREA